MSGIVTDLTMANHYFLAYPQGCEAGGQDLSNEGNSQRRSLNEDSPSVPHGTLFIGATSRKMQKFLADWL
jgi:hypothetical protein